MSNTVFISGEEYNLKNIFGGRAKIVIPDLQRDYCWGLETYDKNNKRQGELVTQFVTGLIEGYNAGQNDFMSLGLLYGYESPKGQIQLCDGQQRLTTLYLLLGVLNRMVSNDELPSLLMSDFEKVDDQEPQLLYAIRESTLYFLSDLTYHYFLSKKNIVIHKAGWYYSEYDQDASIQAMIGAVNKIKTNLEEQVKIIDLNKFSKFVTNNLRFVYFDMGDRLHGEETFVVINTTGEPLTATENLKPVLIGNIMDETEREDRSKEWEDREEWFWEHRDKEHEQTSDGLSNDFYTWYWQIQLLQERMWRGGKPGEINPKDLFLKRQDKTGNEAEEYDSTNRWNADLCLVHKRFAALKTLFQTIQERGALCEVMYSLLRFEKKDSKEDIFVWLRKSSNIDVLLPLISFSEKFGGNPAFSSGIVRFARRLAKNHLDKVYKRVRSGTAESYLDWRYVIQIIEQNDDIDKLMTFDSLQEETFSKQISNVKPTCWYDFDEQMKNNAASRLDIASFEQCKCLRYDLSVLWGERRFATEEIKKRYANILKLYGCLSLQESVAPELANLYRLYRFLRGWGDQIGHVPYCTWEAEGLIYNFYNYETAHVQEFKDKEFLQLLSEDNLTEAIARTIANKLETDDINLNENATPKKFLKMWLVMKTLLANEYGKKLNYWNDKAIGCYINMNNNKINSKLSFSLSNSCTGYLNRNEVKLVDSGYYSNALLLDTPMYIGIAGFVNDVSYSDFKEKRVLESILNVTEGKLRTLFEEFLIKYKV
jgi:hypothetical protein